MVSARGLYLTALAFAVAGVAAMAAGIFLPWECGIEGAYFDRSVGGSTSIVNEWGNCEIGHGLVGAGAAFVLCAAVIGLLGRLTRPAAS
jgi:hypothetical protein